MTLSIERADRRMAWLLIGTVYSSKRNRPLLLYGRLLDDSRPSHGLTATNPDYFLFADHAGPSLARILSVVFSRMPPPARIGGLTFVGSTRPISEGAVRYKAGNPAAGVPNFVPQGDP
jgi:hypothetical protein